MHTFVDKMVELDQGEAWTLDENAGLFRSEPVKQHRTKKLQRPIVKYEATEHHPAQTELITDDVVIGHWTTVKFSGALPRPAKKRMLGCSIASPSCKTRSSLPVFKPTPWRPKTSALARRSFSTWSQRATRFFRETGSRSTPS